MDPNLVGDTPRLSGDQAREFFKVYMKNTIDSMKNKPNAERDLKFIQDVFHNMASNEMYVEIGTRQVYRQDLGSEEIRSLCKFSQKFFKNNKDLEVGKELLGDLAKVEEKVIGEPHHTIDFHNKSRLSVVRDLIFLQNE